MANSHTTTPSPRSRFPEASTVLANGTATPPGDEAIWKRLRDAGFDEETVKRRDKAALIAYITKLETEWNSDWKCTHSYKLTRDFFQ